MWWSLRNQILVPFLVILIVAIGLIAMVTASLSVSRGERMALDQLSRVIETLGRSRFPFTPAVLEKMRGLSGAHFVVFDETGRITAASLPSPIGFDLERLDNPTSEPPGGLDPSATLTVNGVNYLRVLLRPQRETHESLLVLYPETSWKQARWDAAIPPLVVGATAILLVIFASGWIAHRLGKRLASLRVGVAEIASGDFRELQTGTYQDEISEVVVSLNRMNAELSRMRREIRGAERSILLSQFAAGLAHQLRNAVTGARLAVQLHLRRCARREHDQSLDVALRQLALTEEQLKGMLALGRIEPKPKTPCDLNLLLGEIAILLGPACDHAHVTLLTHRAEPAPVVHAERDALLAALLNLALNAIEAVGAGGRVEIGLALDLEANAVRIEVLDTGPGPPENLSDSLFDPFVTGKAAGVGLGLALARRVANDHQGVLSWTRSEGTTRFLLLMPVMSGVGSPVVTNA